MAGLDWSLLNTDPIKPQREGFAYAQAIQQAAQQKQAQQAQMQAGDAYAKGDYAGASQTLARSGDIKGAQSVQETQQKSGHAGLDYVSKALPVFKHIAQTHASDPDGGAQAIGQAFDNVAQEFSAITGTPPDRLAQIKSALIADPQGTLARWEAELPVAYEKVGSSIVRRQGDAAAPIYTAPNDRAPTVHSFTEGNSTVDKQYNPETKQWDTLSKGPRYKPVAAAAPAAAVNLAEADASAPNITGQTGLSMNGFNYLVGNMGAMGRDHATRNAAAAEAQAFAKKSGTDIATIKSQYTALNNVLQNNIQRANQMEILENEVNGTVQNLAPVADRISPSNFKWTREGVQFVGAMQNDPNVQQYSTYLNQLRADLAGFNAVSGGKMTENGNARTDESDFRAAEKIISNGLNSGGARGLNEAIHQTGIKNRSIVQGAIDGATQKVWDLFGVGKNYKPKGKTDLKSKYGLE